MTATTSPAVQTGFPDPYADDGPAADPVVLDGVSKHYGRGRGRVAALDGVSLAFPAGSFTSVLGASGSGKSTLLQCAAGLERPSGGRVRLCGTDLADLSDRRRTVMRRERVGFVFQELNLVPELTVAENIALPLRLGRRRVDRAEIARAAGRVGLDAGQLRRLPAQLSGGQQQRAAIARALVIRPEVIFADEPTGALDPYTAQSVLRVLRETADGATVVIVTHDPQVVRFCDRAVFLHGGRVEAVVGAPQPADVAARLHALGERGARGGTGQSVGVGVGFDSGDGA
jgi:putative ABC transport system ATP-binding protein